MESGTTKPHNVASVRHAINPEDAIADRSGTKRSSTQWSGRTPKHEEATKQQDSWILQQFKSAVLEPMPWHRATKKAGFCVPGFHTTMTS